MGTNSDFMLYIYDEISSCGNITYKKMFGEYGVYCDGKYFALVADNQFMIKITTTNKEMLKDFPTVLPYEGAKPCFLISEFDNKEFLKEVFEKTCEDLAYPKKRLPKKSDNDECFEKLSDLPNIGKVLAKDLEELGISTPKQFKSMGAKETFMRYKLKDPTACIRRLYDFQGAIDGVMAKDLSDEIKNDLKEFYKTL